MAYDANGMTWWNKSGKTMVGLIVLFALALFIRTWFNFEASYNGGNFRWSGTDGYYHSRVIDFIVSTGTFLLHDPMINYPIGAVNPRPPVFVWTIAALGGLLAKFGVTGGDPHVAAQAVAAWAPAFWGALTVFPIYFLGREAFGPKAGMWAAIFIALTAAHVTRSNFGGLDHDSAILFFLVLAAAFFTRSLQLMKRDTYVAHYRSGVGAGWGRFFRENQAAVAYACLTGAAFGAIALIWKGYPYALAIFAVWYGFQLLGNHLRQQDSTGHFLLAMIPFIVTLIMIWPYYAAVGRTVSAVYPMLYILVGVVAASLVFVPTRHLPPVLVLPAAIGAVLIGLLVMIFILPAVGNIFFTGLGYFVQTKLYSTIAEAQRTQLGYLVFSVGVVPFFFGIAGIFFGISSFIRKGRDDHLFVTVWAAIGLVMAFTASRFVFNATTAFALLAGWSMARFLDRVDFSTIKRTWRNVRASGTGVGGTMRQSVRAKHWFAGLAVALLVLLPNAWFAVDAGIPQEYLLANVDEENDAQIEFFSTYFGAFGQDFLGSQWGRAMEYLAAQDTGLDPEKRPAFIAWWDYGFWAAHLGKHPTVADPFQFGYEISGRFIASQSEAEAILWVGIRTIEGDNVYNPGFSSDVRAALDTYGDSLADDITKPLRAKDYDAVYNAVALALTGGTGNVDSADAIRFYSDMSAATGKDVRYFALEGRMFPCDDARTGQVDFGSIFYAPVFLADKNPDDFVQTQYIAGQTAYDLKIYETTADGGSRALDTPYVEDTLGDRFVFTGQTLMPIDAKGNLDYDSRYGSEGIQVSQERLNYKPTFYNSLLYRAWIGGEPTDDQPLPDARGYAPGQDLKHFRLAYHGARAPAPGENLCTAYSRGVNIYQFYEGATVQGTVTDEQGNAVAGATVEVLDNFGVRHDSVETANDGSFELLAPASNENDPSEFVVDSAGPNTLVVRLGGLEVGRQTFSVDEEQANGGTLADSYDFQVPNGALSGIAFRDEDDNGAYDEGIDAVLAGAAVSLDGGERLATTDAEGRFDFGAVRAGGYELRVTAEGYVPATITANVAPGDETTVEVAVTPDDIQVHGLLADMNGVGVEGAQVSFERVSDGASFFGAPAGPDGRYTGAIPAGTYNLTVSYETSEDGKVVRYFTPEPSRLTVEWGDPAQEINLQLQREER